MQTTTDTADVPSKALILIALVQGFVLLLLHQALDSKFWPHNEPQWIFALYAVAFTAPTMLLLGLGERSALVCKWAFAFGVLLLGLGYFTGLQASPLEHVSYEPLLFSFVATMGIATFKALMYIQHFATGKAFSYSRLFLFSWRNFLTLGLSLLFTLCTWGVLMLCAGLFKAIKIEFFYDLFTEKWFYYPALALAHGFGVIIFRKQSTVIDTITRIQQALMKYLLVILVLISIIFLAALPFSGLQVLWDSGGSVLILCMQGLMLFFVNAVYQDDPKTHPYSLWVHRFIYLGIALLPIYSIISFYGLSLRVEQYGWSLSRCWGFLLWAVFAAFSLGYLWGIIRQKDNWLQQLSKVNVRMGLAVLGLMLLVNSPLLDFRAISTNSQVERLNKGLVTLEGFDYRYLRYELAKPGYEALQAIKEKAKAEHPEIVVKINSLYAEQDDQKAATPQAEFMAAIEGVNDNTPASLKDAIYKNMATQVWQLRQNQSYQLISADLDSDGAPEYVFIEVRKQGLQLTMYYLSNSGKWKSQNLQTLYDTPATWGPDNKTALLKALKDGNYGVKESRWDNLEIGGKYLFSPN